MSVFFRIGMVSFFFTMGLLVSALDVAASAPWSAQPHDWTLAQNTNTQTKSLNSPQPNPPGGSPQKSSPPVTQPSNGAKNSSLRAQPTPTPLLTKSSRVATGTKKKLPAPEPTPRPAQPAPLPPLPPPLAEQSLPYPLRYIDRPFTIPKGMYDLFVSLTAANSESTRKEMQLLGYLTELRFRQPITNDFNLLWQPLPLGVHYQPKRSETTVSGVGWNLGWMFQGNLGYKPEFSSYLRHTLDTKRAIEMDLHYYFFLPFKAAPSIWSGSIWSGTFRIGPVFQQTDKLAFSPRIGMTLENVLLSRLFRPGRTHIETRVRSASARITFPFSLWLNWAIAPSLDASFDYSILGSGFREDAAIQLFTFGLTGRW